jgi:type I restriction enzyme S subunit
MRQGWETVPLGELCDVLDHKRRPITKRDREAGPYPYYGATGVLDHVAAYLFDEPLVLVGEDGAKWASGENTAFAVEGKIWVNNHAHVLRPHRDRLLDSWLIYFLNHTDLAEFVSGLTVPKLNQGSLREISVLVPPLAEQQRIVGLLDEAFEGLATAKANAERNLRNARAVFESQLDALFGKREEHTQVESLEALVESGGVELMRGKVISKKDLAATPGDYPVYSSAKENDGKFGEYGLFMFDEELITWSVDGGGRLFHRRKHKFSVTNVGGILRVLHHERISCEYLFRVLCWLHSRVRFDWVRKAHPSVILKIYNEIPLPPIAVQKQISERLRLLEREVQSLSAVFQAKVGALDELKKSLLHQAFSGHL